MLFVFGATAGTPESFEALQTGANWDQSTVPALLQSRQGYLWLATYHGLVRFDGARYVVFDHGNVPELENGLITSLWETPDGVLWIGHETGHLTKFSSDQFRRVSIEKDWPGGSVEAITSDEAGDVWLLNNTGVFFRVRDARRAEIPGGASPTRKVALVHGTNGANWVVAGGKITTLERGQVRPFELPPAEGDDFYERVLPARDGGLWVVSSQSLRKCSGAGWLSLPNTLARPPGTVTSLLETRSGALLAGTLRAGLYLLRPNAPPQIFDTSTGISHNWIRGLCEDHEGNFWLGTGSGLDMLRPRKIQMLKPPDAWKGCGVLSFAIESDGSAWVGTEGAGLYQFERGSWSACDESCGLSNSFVWSVLPVRGNRLLVGTWGGGLFLREGDRFAVPPELSRITEPVTALFEGREGEVWIGTTTGVHRYESGRITWSAGENDLLFPNVRAITETSEGTVWFGMSGGGIASFKDGALRQYLQQSGLESDYILSLLPAEGGGLWIGTADRGLVRLKNGKFSAIGVGQGLRTSVIYHLIEDGAGNLWMGSQAGILRAAKADLERCADGVTPTVPVLTYGREEGLESRSCSGGSQPRCGRGPDGRLWFATPKGIAIVDPANVRTNALPPPVMIEELLVDGEPIALPLHSGSKGQPLKISPGKRRIEFRYTAFSYTVPEKVRFKHRFAGIEGNWVEAGAGRSVEYNLLSPGTYTFRVTACNNDGVWNPNGTELAVTLLPQFWQTWWFQSTAFVVGATVLGFGVLTVVRRGVRHKLEALERQRSLERERARIARDIHDDLGASLTRISLLSQTVRGEIEEREELGTESVLAPPPPPRPSLLHQVDQIYSTARELTRAMDEIVWAVNPKHDTLDSLVTYLGRFAQQFLNATGIRCRLDVPMQLPAWPITSEARHNVYLALKEILNNVVKHAAATEVRISLEILPGGFLLLVVDNGRGFDFQSAVEGRGSEPIAVRAGEPDPSSRVSSGNGLINIRKRLEEIGASCEWNSAPGEGARVKISVPVQTPSSA